MEAAGVFTESLWNDAFSIYQQLIAHPFITKLADGTLPKSCFAHYLSQDILYLKADNLALEKLSKRAREKKEQDFFALLAKDGLEIEHALHNDYLAYFNVKAAKKKSAVIEQYASFLISHSENSPYEVAAASLLPCFWVYNKVGNKIVSKSIQNNPYRKWLDTYKGDEYIWYTEKFIETIEDLMNKASDDTRTKMKDAFVISTEFELAFFEESYHQ